MKKFEEIYKECKLDESVYIKDNRVLIKMLKYNLDDDDSVKFLMKRKYDREDAERIVDSLNRYGSEFGFIEDESEAKDFIAGFDKWEPWLSDEDTQVELDSDGLGSFASQMVKDGIWDLKRAKEFQKGI